MKLVTFTCDGATRAGILTESGEITDLGAPLRNLLDAGETASNGKARRRNDSGRGREDRGARSQPAEGAGDPLPEGSRYAIWQ
jgi:hypothetical protein